MLDFVVLRRRTTLREGRQVCVGFGSQLSQMRPKSGQKRNLSGLTTEETPGQSKKESVPLEGLEPPTVSLGRNCSSIELQRLAPTVYGLARDGPSAAEPATARQRPKSGRTSAMPSSSSCRRPYSAHPSSCQPTGTGPSRPPSCHRSFQAARSAASESDRPRAAASIG